MFNFKMSLNEALLIQRAQLAYYRQRLGRSGVKEIMSRTICPADLNPNEQISVIRINELVPRGGCIENTANQKPYRVFNDPTRLAMHNAIKKGLM